MNNTAIIGGGAAGLAAAIFIKTNNPHIKITVFERLERVGKKLLATGNGRCNLSNINCKNTVMQGDKTVLEHYFGGDRSFAINAINRFDNNALADFLLSLGMPVVYEEDKMFPLSLNAATVLDVLRLKCEQLQIDFRLSSPVSRIDKKSGAFILNGERFDNVIIAAGGKAQPNLGSDGSGYALLQSFGHRLSATMPSITQIKTDTEFVRQLKGLKANINLKIYVNGRFTREQYGQLLFTDYGISGPPAFMLSRIAAQFGGKCSVKIDFMPAYTFDDVLSLISNIVKSPFCDNLTLENLLTPIINKRIGQVIVKSCGYKLNMPTNVLKRSDLQRIASALKAFELNVTGVQGYNVAQVTAGGIITDDFDSETMRSKLQSGLYAVGEVLDVDGDCGGYNLQWAFSSAYAAAMDISEKAK
ncbi:MAG: NAD(P)/FAD-dependent oxidoreductase [Acutalibacteraceae bacterium]